TTAKDFAPSALQLSMSSERVLNIHAVGFSRYGCKRVSVHSFLPTKVGAQVLRD
ncbi:MAG: hypothetical protein OGMRLDGQ_000513, partial [Candidatus Fervidibacter sp.]